MNNKPIITYAGDLKVFERLQSALEKSLSAESAEWRRSYGRPPKMVQVKSNFVPFSPESISKQELKLAGKAVLHTYWTDCPDMDTYKSSVRESISSWLTTLKHHGVTDWVVILVETSDFKKGNKLLLRTTVLDKIKTDFGQKQNDRCLSLVEPRQQEARSAESWSVLMSAFRQLVLSAHGKAITKFEEGMRAQREKRNLPTWSYHNYFLLQEELAQVFESLGLYDEALVQYDELDALFTQFVLNSQVGEMPAWLRSFTSECDSWMGVSLSSKDSNQNASRTLIQNKNITLIQFRNYLFSRQCELLILLNKPWEIAERSLLFVHNCINEVKILEVEVAAGGLACWGFLTALEVTNTCNTFSESAQVEAFSIHTAGLWDYARVKLEQLGELCGLMPEQTPSSEQLHLVVNLSAGMGIDPDSGKSPVQTLKEALSNKQCFQKHYLELSELAMGTFKHLGRMRCARAVGRSLARFYIRAEEHSKALPFLTDALRDALQHPGWDLIAGYLEVEIAHCAKAIRDQERYVRTCAEIACNMALSAEERHKYFMEMLENLADLGSKQVIVAGDNMLQISKVLLAGRKESLSPGSELEAELTLISRLPAPLMCPKVGISLERTVPTVQSPKKVLQRVHSHHVESQSVPPRPFKRSATTTDIVPESSAKPRKAISLASFRLELEQQLEYKQDKSLSSASLICRNAQKLLRRKESHGNLMKEQVEKIECPLALASENVELQPGVNTVKLKCKVTEAGVLKSQQLCLTISPSLEMIIDAVALLEYSVLSQQPAIALDKIEPDLIAGIPQHMELKLSSGTTTVSEGKKTWLRCSRGLSMQRPDCKEMQRDIEVAIPAMGPNQTRTIPITVLANCLPQKDASTIEHKVTVVCPWTGEEKQVCVHFIPPFISLHRLHTANVRKFIAVSLHGQTKQPFKLINPKLEDLSGQGVELTPLNPPGDHVVCIDISVCFMWEVILKGEEMPLKFDFGVNYQYGDDTEDRKYSCLVDMHDYTTLYTVRAKVEPGKGSEFCRAGTMCHLSININRLHPNTPQTALMYEVLTDQSMWAVCGRTAGVVTVEEGGKHSVILDVMPLTGGYLPLPAIRLSRYIPADHKPADGWNSTSGGSPNTSLPRLEPFCMGQVYNWSKAQQVHVLPGAASSSTVDVSS